MVNGSLTISRQCRHMTCQLHPFDNVAEIPAPQDVIELLRSYAKAARKTRRSLDEAPRNDHLSILAEVRASLDRINASTD